MGFGGSVSAMITMMRNNKSLLRSKKSFTILREEKERDIGRKALKGKELKIEPLSDELRLKIRAAAVKRRRKDRIVSISIIAILIIIVASIYNSCSTSEGQKDNLIGKTEIIQEKNKFHLYMKEGNKWIEESNYHNAIFQFDLAVKNNPNNVEAQLGLTKALLGKCFKEKGRCKEAEIQFDFFIKNYKNNSKLSDYLLGFLSEIGDDDRLEELEKLLFQEPTKYVVVY